jgi:hypothetical protein
LYRRPTKQGWFTSAQKSALEELLLAAGERLQVARLTDFDIQIEPLGQLTPESCLTEAAAALLREMDEFESLISVAESAAAAQMPVPMEVENWTATKAIPGQAPSVLAKGDPASREIDARALQGAANA